MLSNMHRNKIKITVLGGGSFGTALANISGVNGHFVRQWMRSSSQVEEMNTCHTNRKYLGDFQINSSVQAMKDIHGAVENADLILAAIPSQSFRPVIRMLGGYVKDKVIISTAKGVEAPGFQLMSQILEEELPEAKAGVLSGPNLAQEIIEKAITATVVASQHQEVCRLVQRALQCAYFKIYASADPYGVQLGGALKNIYAIAAGMASARGMGENSRSMLITRALAEMSHFAVTMGADPMTFLGLSGVGDLIVTCISPLSRNFRLGYALGKGRTLEEARESLGQVAEGVHALALVKQKADENNVHMPIVSGLNAVIFEGRSIEEMLRKGLLSEQRNDVEFMLQQGEIKR